MDARKVHELFLSQYEQNTGGTTPVIQNIDFKTPDNSLNQNPKPVQSKSNIGGIKWGKIALISLLRHPLISLLVRQRITPPQPFFKEEENLGRNPHTRFGLVK